FNTWLQAIGFISEPLTLVRNEFGVIVGMTHFLIPFAVFPLASSMRSLDDRVLLAARGLGSSRMRTFWSVFVPMTRSGGGRSVMVAELIYLRIFQSPDWGLGAAISVVLVLFVGALMALVFRYVRPKQLI
ncbi:MAG: ABC transporter permease subunit, partial [Mesorhizobium sp.]